MVKLMNERLKRLMSTFDGEFEMLLGGIYELSKDFEWSIGILEWESWCNFYSDCDCYADILCELKYDSILWEDRDDLDTDEFYQFILTHEGLDHEEETKAFLRKGGWRLSPTGLAMCFDDEVLKYNQF